MKIIFLILLATVGSLTTYACRCNTMTYSEEVEYADQIFTGKVLKKTTADAAYYLFSVDRVFKGEEIDSLTIKTGFGGQDCGMLFEVGETYLVYSKHKETSWCRRNAFAKENSDIHKLRYLFDTSYSDDIGKTSSPILTDQEADYFNADLLSQRGEFNFRGKKVAFVMKDSFIDKQRYFENWGGRKVVNNLVILTEEEKKATHGYDAIIVSWRKQGVSNRYRKRLINRLS